MSEMLKLVDTDKTGCGIVEGEIHFQKMPTQIMGIPGATTIRPDQTSAGV